MWQLLFDYTCLALSSFLAGGINALAGGGTLLTFPTLLGVLLPRFGEAAGVLANGTSTVALVPASLGSSWGFRREIAALWHLLAWLSLPSVIGGAIGAWLLVRFPERFNALIPWLILAAAILFALQPTLSRLYARRKRESEMLAASVTNRSPSPRAIAGMMLMQLGIAIYGGYFGAGIGILMLSGLGLMGLTNIHEMNGLKSLLGTLINGVAIVVLVAAGKVVWPLAMIMMATSVFGGFIAAHYSRQINGRYIRWFVVAVGFSLAGWYLTRRS
jgi:uncharacterized membrane protein YfcA